MSREAPQLLGQLSELEKWRTKGMRLSWRTSVGITKIKLGMEEYEW